jgi:hypothetical protein
MEWLGAANIRMADALNQEKTFINSFFWIDAEE